MGFWNPVGAAQSAIGGMTNNKVANAMPGMKSVGKSIRNAPGIKKKKQPSLGSMGARPMTPMAPSPEVVQKNMPAPMAKPGHLPLVNQIDKPMSTGAPMGQPQPAMSAGREQPQAQAVPELPPMNEPPRVDLAPPPSMGEMPRQGGIGPSDPMEQMAIQNQMKQVPPPPDPLADMQLMGQPAATNNMMADAAPPSRINEMRSMGAPGGLGPSRRPDIMRKRRR